MALAKAAMAQNFFITGLPRSRTAWFAAYFSAYPDVWCWHEGLKGCAVPAEFCNRMQPLGPHPAELIIGNSDSGLPLMNLEIMFPDVPVIVIHRSFIDSVNSVMESMAINNPPQEMIDMLNRIHERMRYIKGLHVDFNDIDARMREICEWIGLEYREDIHKLYAPLNIQTMDSTADDKALKWLPFAQ
ncbi:MAG: hypothetical protein ACR2PR_11680 [Pseudohongiellaceae bacterium]